MTEEFLSRKEWISGVRITEARMASELLIPNVGSASGAGLSERAERAGNKADGPAFSSLLKDRLSQEGAALGATSTPIKFSGHALDRIRDRGISMNGELMKKLEGAVDSAAKKGSKDSLVLTDDAAFIVSVKNRTVITVLDRGAMNGNVFTNIDSTVVV